MTTVWLFAPSTRRPQDFHRLRLSEQCFHCSLQVVVVSLQHFEQVIWRCVGEQRVEGVEEVFFHFVSKTGGET